MESGTAIAVALAEAESVTWMRPGVGLRGAIEIARAQAHQLFQCILACLQIARPAWAIGSELDVPEVQRVEIDGGGQGLV